MGRYKSRRTNKFIHHDEFIPLQNQNLNSLLFKPSTNSPQNKTDKLDKTNVVYLLSCKDCNTNYIGETSRSFSVRFKEHVKDVSRVVAENKISAISQHARLNKHTFDFVKFVDMGNSYLDLVLKEAMYILFNQDLLCNDRSIASSVFVSPHWLPLKPYFALNI